MKYLFIHATSNMLKLSFMFISIFCFSHVVYAGDLDSSDGYGQIEQILKEVRGGSDNYKHLPAKKAERGVSANYKRLAAKKAEKFSGFEGSEFNQIEQFSKCRKQF